MSAPAIDLPNRCVAEGNARVKQSARAHLADAHKIIFATAFIDRYLKDRLAHRDR